MGLPGKYIAPNRGRCDSQRPLKFFIENAPVYTLKKVMEELSFSGLLTMNELFIVGTKNRVKFYFVIYS